MAKQVYAVLKLKDEFTKPINNATKGTKNYEKQVKLANKKLATFANTMKTKFKTACKTAAVGVAGLTAAAGKLVTETASYGDTVDKMSQKIGVSREAYQELDFITSQTGASVSNLKAGLKTLTAQMTKTSDEGIDNSSAFERLGIAVTDVNGEYRSQEDVMWDVFSALQKVENQTEKAALANQLLGKAGTELMPMLNGEAGSIEALKEKAHELGLVMSDEDIDASVNFTDTMDQLKRSLQSVGFSVGSELMPVFQSLASWVVTNMPTIRQTVGEVVNKVKGWIAQLSNVIAFLRQHLTALKVIAAVVIGVIGAFKIISVVSALMSAWTTITGILEAAQLSLNFTMIACPLMLLVAGLVLLILNWKKVGEWIDKAKAKFEAIIEPITNVISKLKNLFGFSGKSVNVGVNENTSGNGSGNGKGEKRHALGTTYFAGGSTRFNEGGRTEAAVLPSGTQIIPADKVAKTFNNSNSVTVNLTVQGNVIGNQAYMEQMGNYIAKRLTAAMGNV